MNILFSYTVPDLGARLLDILVNEYLEQGDTVRYMGDAVTSSVEHIDFATNTPTPADVNIFELRVADISIDYARYVHAAADNLATAPIPDWASGFPDISVVSPQPIASQTTLRKVAVRDSQIASGFEWVPGAVFQTRPKDLTLISGRVTKILALSYFGEVHPDFNWLKEDNTPYLFTPDEFMRFAIAVDEFVEQKYINSWQ